jgi:hypothetical protein
MQWAPPLPGRIKTGEGSCPRGAGHCTSSPSSRVKKIGSRVLGGRRPPLPGSGFRSLVAIHLSLQLVASRGTDVRYGSEGQSFPSSSITLLTSRPSHPIYPAYLTSITELFKNRNERRILLYLDVVSNGRIESKRGADDELNKKKSGLNCSVTSVACRSWASSQW